MTVSFLMYDPFISKMCRSILWSFLKDFYWLIIFTWVI